MRAARSGLSRYATSGMLVAALVALALFAVAYDNGSYSLAARATLAVAAWWAIVLAVAFRLVTTRRPPLATLVVGSALVGLSLWTLVSAFRAPSAEEAFAELNRTTLYLGLYVLTVLAVPRALVGRVLDGLTVGVAAIGAVALSSRLVPGLFSDRDLGVYLPSAATRLSFPLGYWNGLAIFLALGLPLLLRVALVGRTRLARGLALGAVPVLGAGVYLTSSRGGVATALVGAILFVALARPTSDALLATGLAGGSSLVAVAVLTPFDELVNGPLGTNTVRAQGAAAAALVAAVAVATGVAWVLVGGHLRSRVVPRLAGRAAAAALLAAAVVLAVAADPVQRFEVFKRIPGEGDDIAADDFVRAHLLSGNGSGRWQFWTAAAEAWREEPVLGVGAGSFEHWWSEHASFTYSVRDAHSLYVEVLGELGLVGLALVLVVLAVGIGSGVSRTRRGPPELRATRAALTAVVGAYAVAAGVDWMWELTAVTALAVVALGLLTGPATELLSGPHAASSPHGTRLGLPTFGLAVLGLLVCWVVVSAQLLPLLAQRSIVRSEERVRRGDLVAAQEEALAAREIQPWAASPYLQLALVAERGGDLVRALEYAEQAIERSPKDWRLHLVAARLETKLGHVTAAELRLRAAVALNPRSPLFDSLGRR
ncbi:MAG TPA: O-antigen ligase family protein [Gaiellaceae bacterium]|nr:O-antigen ligase family protein [Gaiellaceae bacterium]